MAIGGPWFLEITVKSWTICHRPSRPSFRTLITTIHRLLLTTFTLCRRGGCEIGQIEQTIASIRVLKEGVFKWRRAVHGFQKFRRNHGQSASAPEDPLFGP